MHLCLNPVLPLIEANYLPTPTFQLMAISVHICGTRVVCYYKKMKTHSLDRFTSDNILLGFQCECLPIVLI